MMHDHEKSDSAKVATKPTNQAERSAAESVEPRAETKRNASEQSTHRTLSRVRVYGKRQRLAMLGLVPLPNSSMISRARVHVCEVVGIRG
jgi:hypothetical protein